MYHGPFTVSILQGDTKSGNALSGATKESQRLLNVNRVFVLALVPKIFAAEL